MRSPWTEESIKYIEALKKLGKTVSYSPVIAKARGDHNIYEFGTQLERAAHTALGRTDGIATLSTEPNLYFKAQIDKGLPDTGEAQVVIGGRSFFSNGALTEQAINLLILFTPSVDGDGLRADKTYVVRKLHFDFDRGNVGQNRPTSHLQVGGKIADIMVAHRGGEGIERETFNELDVPRIPSPPYGLASVLDIALREFAPPAMQALTKEAFWNELVRETEILLLSNYHQRLYDECRNRSTRTTYTHHCEVIVSDMKP